MKARFRRHLSFANVTSLMALVFAMGGTGYALTISKNSVGSQQLKKGGVTNSEIGTSAVTSTKVKNRSLFARDFALGQLPAGAPGANDATGATGPAGPTGPQGLTGIVGGAITVQREDLNVADGVASGFQAHVQPEPRSSAAAGRSTRPAWLTST